MLRRNLRSDFVGGAYVFPGGAVDESDTEAYDLVLGLDDAAASRRLELERGGLAFYVACLRELFEEGGLLIACDEAGTPVTTSAPSDVERWADRRRALNAGDVGFVEILRGERLLLDLRGIEYLAHWITPVGPPRRYDTRFFVALAPPGQVATHDDAETVADTWVRPLDALAAQRRGEFEMIRPTIYNLEAVAHFANAREVLDYARGLTSIPCVEPRIIDRGGEIVIVNPGEVGYDERGTGEVREK
jgi:8-oxo-dGTP pyrophosphatase MutT (NUDIX family)